MRVDTTRVLSVGGSLLPIGVVGERSEFYVKPPIGTPLLIFPRFRFLKTFPQGNTSVRQRGFEIRACPVLGWMPKAIELHLTVCLSYRWQLGPNKWSLPTTKLLDPIGVTTIRVSFKGKPRTCYRWIYLQLTGTRGVDNGGVRAK